MRHFFVFFFFFILFLDTFFQLSFRRQTELQQQQNILKENLFRFLVHLRCSSTVSTSRHCVVDKRITVLLSLRFFGLIYRNFLNSVFSCVCVCVDRWIDYDLLCSRFMEIFFRFFFSFQFLSFNKNTN